MKHKSIAFCSVLVASAVLLHGCKMSTEQKLALGVGALGALNNISTDANASAEATDVSAEETLQTQAESRIKGNFGYNLGDTFNTNKCLKGTIEEYECQVSVNGNTVFSKAFISYHPQTKEIFKIIGETPVKEITILEGMKNGNSTSDYKRQYVSTETFSHVLKEKTFIVDGLKQAGVLEKDYEFDNSETWLLNGKNKRLVLKEEFTETNMGNIFARKPFNKVKVLLAYMDMSIAKDAAKHLQSVENQKRLSKMKGNF